MNVGGGAKFHLVIIYNHCDGWFEIKEILIHSKNIENLSVEFKKL